MEFLVYLTDLKTLVKLAEPTIVNGIQVSQAHMSMYEFVNLPNHFTWSQTTRGENRKGKKRGKHLEVFTPTQMIGAICVYTDGSVERLDGNSRSYFIRNGLMSNVPETMFITVFTGVDKKTSIDLFSAFDNKNAVDMPNDVLNYGYKEVGLRVSSPALLFNATQAIKTACALLDQGKELPARMAIGAAISTTKKGIQDLDSLDIGGSFKVKRSSRSASALAAYIALCSQFSHGRVAVMKFIALPDTEGFIRELSDVYGSGGSATTAKAEQIYRKLEAMLESKSNW